MAVKFQGEHDNVLSRCYGDFSVARVHSLDKATIRIVNFTEVITASASWSQHLSLEEVLLKMYEIDTDMKKNLQRFLKSMV